MTQPKGAGKYPVMKPPFEEIPRVDFAEGFDAGKLHSGWGIGGYNTVRKNMYTAPQYGNKRNVHMGVDIWAPAGEPVYAPLDGVVAYSAFHDQKGNYGGTLVLKHTTGQTTFYALYGHLSLASVEELSLGGEVKTGQVTGWIGTEEENGNWYPHLHYQLCMEDPGEADMPGVVSGSLRRSSQKLYPDPEKVIGRLIP